MRRTAILLATAAVLVAIAGFFRHVTRVHGVITGLVAVDASHAVVKVHAPKEHGFAARDWVALLDAEGHYVWAERLPSPPTLGGHEGLLVDDGTVYVRMRDLDGSGTTNAYRLEDGALRWSTHLDDAPIGLRIDLVAEGANVVQGIDPPGMTSTRLVSLAKADGKIVSERIVDTFTPDEEVGCTAHGELITLARNRVMARRLDDGSERPLGAFALPESLRMGHIYGCGTRKGRFVFTVEVWSRLSTALHLGLIELPPNGAAPIVTLLPEEPDGMRFYGVEVKPFRGSLPRFIPLELTNVDRQQNEMAVLDLDERRLVRHGPGLEHFYGRVSRQGDDFLLTRQQGHRFVLARFDAARGEITKAVAIGGDDFWQPFHAAGGRLWITGDQGFVVLDETTLAKVGGTTDANDATPEVKAWLPD